MTVIVGLGNPGHTYHDTRHNVGFRIIQMLSEQRHVALQERVVSPADGRPSAVYGDYKDGGRTIRLLMPLTMMNESGEALRGFDLKADPLLIVCDDVNLPLGAIRLRPQGSAGGHHGLESCLAILGTEQVARLRVGVGTEKLPADLHDFVLSPFTSAERPEIMQAYAQAVEACETWITEGIERAMNRHNTKVQD